MLGALMDAAAELNRSQICPEDLVRTCESIVTTVEKLGFKILLDPLKRSQEIGRGFSSRVFLVSRPDGSKAALKVRRARSKRDSLALEGYILELLMGSYIAPRVFSYGDDYILMEYISGISVGRAFELFKRGAIDDPYLRSAISSTLKALHILDSLGIDHLEIGDPREHIIFHHGIPYAVKIIDFESATLKPYPSNLPRFIGGFILRKASWIFGVDIEEILEMMRIYKKDHVMRVYIVNRLVEAISIKKPF
jgi:predicted Ser/Thr protein kinase